MSQFCDSQGSFSLKSYYVGHSFEPCVCATVCLHAVNSCLFLIYPNIWCFPTVCGYPVLCIPYIILHATGFCFLWFVHLLTWFFSVRLYPFMLRTLPPFLYTCLWSSPLSCVIHVNPCVAIVTLLLLLLFLLLFLSCLPCICFCVLVCVALSYVIPVLRFLCRLCILSAWRLVCAFLASLCDATCAVSLLLSSPSFYIYVIRARVVGVVPSSFVSWPSFRPSRRKSRSWAPSTQRKKWRKASGATTTWQTRTSAKSYSSRSCWKSASCSTQPRESHSTRRSVTPSSRKRSEPGPKAW